MTIRRTFVVCLALGVLAGCSSKKKAPGAGPDAAARAKEDQARAAAADPLWAVAPADAAFGVVIGDGAFARGLDGVVALTKIAEAHPTGKQLVEGLRKEIMTELPFDPWDPAAWKQAGIDLGKGAAVFAPGDMEDPSLFVLPVGDLAAFRKTVKAETTKDGDLELDRFGDSDPEPDENDMVCAMAGGRYLCARTAGAIRAAAKAHDAPLAKAVKGLPGPQRGDVECHTLTTEIQDEGFAGFLASIAPAVTDVSGLWVSLRLERDGVTGRAWLLGQPGFLAKKSLAPRKPSAKLDLVKGAAGVTRIHLDPGLFLSDAPPSMPVGGADLREDVLDQLTGDFVLVSAGKSVFGGALLAQVKDPKRVEKAVEGICTVLGAVDTLQDVAYDKGTCTGTLAMPEDTPFQLSAPMKVVLSVHGGVLALATADYDLAARKGSVVDAAGSAESREILTGAATFAMWGRGFDFFGAVPAELLAQFPPDVTEAFDYLELASWIGLHVYDLGIAGGVEADGAHLLFRATTFAADPDDARQAYAAALGKRLARDRAGWEAALADVAKKHPDTLVGKQAQLIVGGVPALGAGTGILAALAIPSFMKYIARSKTTEAVMGLKKIHDGARSYYEEGPKKFPPSAPMTPAAGSCCGQPGDRCAPNPQAWAGEGWSALKFSMDEPHRYSYEFISVGEGATATFTARAVGDLDCDGVYSTYEAYGSIDPSGYLIGSSAIAKENELE